MVYFRIWRYAITTACVFLLSALGNAGPAESTVYVAGLNYQVVMKGTGSGFCISKGYVLTAGHCANMGSTTRVRDYKGVWHNATVYAKGEPDWAILSVPTLDVPHLPIDFDGVRQNEAVGVYGRFAEGMRSNGGHVQDWMFQGAYQHATTKVYPGYSGGPVVDADGEVVGIVSQMTPGGNTLYVPVLSVGR